MSLTTATQLAAAIHTLTHPDTALETFNTIRKDIISYLNSDYRPTHTRFTNIYKLIIKDDLVKGNATFRDFGEAIMGEDALTEGWKKLITRAGIEKTIEETMRSLPKQKTQPPKKQTAQQKKKETEAR